MKRRISKLVFVFNNKTELKEIIEVHRHRKLLQALADNKKMEIRK